jgi:cytidylate kinase
MAVLCISRQFGAGGWPLAKSLAEQLGYHFVSQGIINKMAEEANVSVEWIHSVEKEAGDRLMRLVSKLISSDFIERHIGESRSDFDEKKYVAFLKKLVLSIASRDNVVILGRGSQYILPDSPNTVKILLVADLEDRIKFIEKIWNLKKSEAKNQVVTRQKRRKAFLKNFGKMDPDDPGLYHLAVNISKVGLEQAEEIIIGLVKKAENQS